LYQQLFLYVKSVIVRGIHCCSIELQIISMFMNARIFTKVFYRRTGLGLKELKKYLIKKRSCGRTVSQYLFDVSSSNGWIMDLIRRF
jgi:hypothetical protein